MRRFEKAGRFRLGAAAVVMTGLAAMSAATVTGAPLEGPACEQLQVKMDALRKSGVEADMVLGPAWAKANLGPGRLQLIAEFLEIDEQLNFRCGLAKQHIVLPTTIEGGEEEIPTPGEAPKEATVQGGPSGTLPLPQKSPAKRPTAKGKDAKGKDGKSAAIKPAAKPAPAPKSAAKQGEAGKTPQGPAKAPAKKAPDKAPAAKKARVDDAYRPPRIEPGGDRAPAPAKQ